MGGVQTSARLSWTPLAPFGVELHGDLAELGPEGRLSIGTLLDEHGLLLVRGQQLTLAAQFDLMAMIGPVLGSRATLNYVAPDDGVLGTGALGFHSDLAFAPAPFEYISLHAIEVVDGETSTLFADGATAYERLPENLRRQLGGLSAAAVSSSANGRTVRYHIPASAVRYDRPAVIDHPRTTRPILYVNQAQTARFNELDEAASDALLADLFDILYAPDAVLEHRWVTGDLLIWDNLRLQHARASLAGVTRRKLQRVVVAPLSLYEQVPDFKAGDPK